MDKRILVMIVLCTLGCADTGGRAGTEPDTTAGDLAHETVPDESDVTADWIDPDKGLELDLPPDIDLSSIDPGSSCM